MKITVIREDNPEGAAVTIDPQNGSPPWVEKRITASRTNPLGYCLDEANEFAETIARGARLLAHSAASRVNVEVRKAPRPRR